MNYNAKEHGQIPCIILLYCNLWDRGKPLSHKIYLYNLLLQPPLHFLLHCLAYGQPIQVSPRFFARTRYHTIIINSKMYYFLPSSLSFLFVFTITPATKATINAIAIKPPIAAPTLRVLPATRVPIVYTKYATV